MIVLLKDKTILTVPRAKEIGTPFNGNSDILTLLEGGSSYKPVAFVNKNELLAIFVKDEDYIASIGAELVRNLK